MEDVNTDDVSTDDDEYNEEILVYTANEILKIGLLLVGFRRRRIRRAKKKTNIVRFRGHFGSNPNVCAQIFTLQTLNEKHQESPSLPRVYLNRRSVKEIPSS